MARGTGVEGRQAALYLRIVTVFVYTGDALAVLSLFEDVRHRGQRKVTSQRIKICWLGYLKSVNPRYPMVLRHATIHQVTSKSRSHLLRISNLLALLLQT